MVYNKSYVIGVIIIIIVLVIVAIIMIYVDHDNINNPKPNIEYNNMISSYNMSYTVIIIIDSILANRDIDNNVKDLNNLLSTSTSNSRKYYIKKKWNELNSRIPREKILNSINMHIDKEKKTLYNILNYIDRYILGVKSKSITRDYITEYVIGTIFSRCLK